MLYQSHTQFPRNTSYTALRKKPQSPDRFQMDYERDAYLERIREQQRLQDLRYQQDQRLNSEYRAMRERSQQNYLKYDQSAHLQRYDPVDLNPKTEENDEKNKKDEKLRQELEALRQKAPAFTLKDDLSNMDGEIDKLRSAFMNLLDEHNKRNEDKEKGELMLDDSDDKLKRRKSKYGPLDPDYLKWTKCFKRKSVRWDEQIGDVPDIASLTRLSQNFSQSFNNEGGQQEQQISQRKSLSRTRNSEKNLEGSNSRKVSIRKLSTAKKSQQSKTYEAEASSQSSKPPKYITPHKSGSKGLRASTASIGFSNLKTEASTTAKKKKKSTKNTNKSSTLSAQEIQDLAQKVAGIVQNQLLLNGQKKVVYQDKNDVGLQKFVDLCNKHFQECDNFTKESNEVL